MKVLLNKIASLFSVKSIVTIILTVVFSILALDGKLTQEFLTIYSVIIAFYFGTQHEKSIKEITETVETPKEPEMIPQEVVVENITPTINDNITI